MSWVQQAIGDFGKTIGMPDLELNSHNKLRLMLGTDTILSFNYIDSLPIKEIIISVEKEVSYIPYQALKNILESSHFEKQPQIIFQSGILENKCIYSARILERSFNISAIEKAINFLENLE